MTDDPVTFHGLPHPATEAVFTHLRAIVAGVAGEAAAAAWSLVTDPWAAPVGGGRHFFLRSEAMSSLAMVAAANVPAAPFISVGHALAARVERRWDHLPALSIEETIRDAAATARWLSEQGLVSCDGKALEIIGEATIRLRQRRELLVNPARFFQQIPWDEACRLLLTPTDRLLGTGRGGDGVPSLVQGWGEPEDKLCRLHAAIGALRLLAPAGALVLRCLCAEPPNPAGLTVHVDGRPVPVGIHGNDHRELHIPLHNRRDADPPRAITVEFVEHRLEGVPGFGLAGFGIGPTLRLDRCTEEPELPDALAAAGFALIGDAPPCSPDADGMWLEALAAGHRPAKLLIVAEDAPAALQKLQPRLPNGTMLAAASTGQGSAGQPPAAGQVFHADLAAVTDWPVIGGARFDLIHLQGVVRLPELTGKLRWFVRHLSYRGILSGCEQSVADARHVVAALGRGIDRRFLTFLLEGSRWRAIPHAHWRA